VKQAIRRHALVKLQVPIDVVKVLMEKNRLDILTNIPIAEIESVSIPYVKQLVKILKGRRQKKKMA
jgi:uncharacterized SAM-dependent methyltransferase